ncbi:hypothetical protein FBZ98_103813 [Rhizobium sp. ERR 922]|uniref:hypothetical protein n=1 Tax=unclassified Rhizobium TaxID=2613769 RepID=UPI0011A30BBE|nr:MULTISPECIES: hypothetical protein [unclassified Rhizobium]TWB55416.1 hypothetical protein FBZ98_103813 [Rhizobium sp. ERR 922]TWB97249.1 hypothetical protein FBZ97_10370 [Rhizobium sp. ERR 942]
MWERAHEAWLLQLSIQVETLERFVASLPGAAKVDFAAIKAALEKEYNGPHGDVVRAETIARWVDVAPKRIGAMATGQEIPEFDPESSN